ncbi:MAG: hypothetical protein VX730_06865, partial [Pseudomonadota bacterium]|nr:hypothetical protein [Pseudomonadota bacterium]
MLLVAPMVHSQATFNVQSSGRGLENAKMGARMQQLHDSQQATIDLLQPQSFSVLPDCDALGEKINWNAGTNSFTCIQEDDPTVYGFAKDPLPTCAGTEFLQGDGTDLSCVDATSVVTGSEIDPTVTDFAKDPLPTCGANEALKGNGTSLTCVAISGAGVESDPTVYSFAQSPLPTCGVGQVLRADGTSLSCVTDTDGGFTESDPLTMTFAKGTLPVCAADEVLSNTDGLGQAFACVDAATAAAGAADDLGSHVATQALDMATYAINNVADPTGAQDAATKAYVDAEVAAGVASVSETDPTVEAFAKNNLPNCTASQLLSGNGTALSCVDAATAAAGAADDMGDHVADQNIQLGSYYLSGDGDNEGVQVSGSGAVSILKNGAATGLDVQTNGAGGIGVHGRATGSSGVGVRATANDATATALIVSSTNGKAFEVASGSVHMGSGRVQDVADPTAAQDAATKAYVDAQVAGGSGDSGTLDGLDSTQFLRSDQADSTTGALGVGNADRDGTLTVTGLAGHDITSANAAGQGILVLQGTTGDSA